MKNKVLTFFLAMGIPLSTFVTSNASSAGCTGICGSCGFNCTPGVFALVLLAGKFLWHKLKGRVMADA
ncbi:MAG: hypothetical protein SO119_02915 [Phascolarctobacterium sp.]|nr:hypothetical protein [Phascolarctobacterium sp.]